MGKIETLQNIDIFIDTKKNKHSFRFNVDFIRNPTSFSKKIFVGFFYSKKSVTFVL